MSGTTTVLLSARELSTTADRFGIDLVHFGITIIANLGIGYVTPPVGTCLYVACSISKEPLDRVIKPLVPLLLVMVVMLAVVALVPDLTWRSRGFSTAGRLVTPPRRNADSEPPNTA